MNRINMIDLGVTRLVCWAGFVFCSPKGASENSQGCSEAEGEREPLERMRFPCVFGFPGVALRFTPGYSRTPPWGYRTANCVTPNVLRFREVGSSSRVHRGMERS